MKKSSKNFIIGATIGFALAFYILAANNYILSVVIYFPMRIVNLIDKILYWMDPNMWRGPFEWAEQILIFIAMTMWYGFIFLFSSKIIGWVKNKFKKENKKRAI